MLGLLGVEHRLQALGRETQDKDGLAERVRLFFSNVKVAQIKTHSG